ncbi:hypothetical protein KVQ64_003608 [Vibrio vulnificus]|uniref:hypothetical protein n=1 Tax=Vibrio TaxID=662 RepID=UPI00102983A7|nr:MULTISPECIES: hypothetical protein [Vibrio]EHS1185293.1 hypothetical protein [Vibrio vulnificus]ELA7147819.1 hypothetical protein [Vibrio parahaemolyticus]MCC3829742.1 hypothetical protein [Vibrio parahaemolyticus]MCE7602267.1 hypothetical protein [Vibrio fluvialis]RZQ45495.1 hypothetical protein D8T55_05285 [Vibrio vulnificus]
MTDSLSKFRDRLDKELKIRKTKDYVSLKVTSKLCIYQSRDRDYTLNVMKNVSGFAVGEKIPVHIDLRSCPGVTAAAMVMLFAEVSRARLVTEVHGIIKIFFPPKGTAIRKLFQQSGWERALVIEHTKLQDLVRDNQLFQSNSNPNEATQAVYKLLTSHGLELDAPEVKRFTKGVSEAMLNVINHAYDHEEFPLEGIGRRWWQACFVKEVADKKAKMVFIIYDLGQGILSSLEKESDETPEQHISRAMRYGVTRTGDPKRGKGTKDIEDAAQIREESILLVGSNDVSYIKWKDGKVRIELGLLPFFGTIVEWQINL